MSLRLASKYPWWPLAMVLVVLVCIPASAEAG